MATERYPTEPAEQAVIITRVLDAPRDLVFKAWTEPERLMQWWGPRGFTTPSCAVDLREGGVSHCCMRSPEGKDYWSKSVYREIVEPERLVYTDSFADAEGNVVPASYYGMSEDWPLEFLVTVTFDEYDDKTRFTLRHFGIPLGHDADMCADGWNESFDKLTEYLEGK